MCYIGDWRIKQDIIVDNVCTITGNTAPTASHPLFNATRHFFVRGFKIIDLTP